MYNIVNICSTTGKKTVHGKFPTVFLYNLHKVYNFARYSVGVLPQWRLNTLVK